MSTDLSLLLAALAGCVPGALGAAIFFLRKQQTFVAQIATLNAQLEAAQRDAAEKLAWTEQAQARLSDSFQTLGAAALRANNQAFLDLAQQALARFQQGARDDLEQRQQAIDALVQPLRESLERVDRSMSEIERARAAAYSALSEQLQSLTRAQATLQIETTKLATALSTTRTAGTWGELQLRRVVDLAGMVEHCDFTEQESAGGRRPDLVVHLPFGQKIVVDAKAPTDAFREAATATDPILRTEKLREHAARVRGHVEALSARAYWEQFQPSPEFVVLFLPGDQFLSAALEADPALVDRAIEKRVLLATPSTLIALLKAAAYGWRQEAVSHNAQKISALGRELFDRLCRLADHFAALGKNLNQAVAAYNRAAGSLESRVLVAARRFQELGAAGTSQLETPQPVEQVARTLQTPETTPLSNRQNATQQ